MQSMDQIWQEYLAGGGEPNATDFGVWLIRSAPELPAPAVPMAGANTDGQGNPLGYDALDRTVRSAILVGRLERFLHQLSKPAFREAGLSSDEFIVLATLMYMPRPAKTQLLRQCLIEIPTGSELLKRMKQAGLILEKPNPEDGRSACISLSAKGRQCLVRTFQRLGQMEDALSVLTESEKETLLQLLERLDLHHSQRHEIRQVRELMQATG
jgi:DNA-binding MarR family transcriptional regulator